MTPLESTLEAPVAQKVRLPFIYAKNQGVLLDWSEGIPQLLFARIPSAAVYAEVFRLIRSEFQLIQLEEQAFSRRLSDFYQNDSSEALQDAAGISDDMDLGSLALAVPATEDLLEQNDDAPVIRLINALLSEAIKENASDIHIETFESSLVVRIRVDGLLREILQLQRNLAALLVSRIKVMAKLDIAEKRIPQDGRISLKVAGKEVDVRVSTLPSTNGERVVLRLLDKAIERLDLDHLGMSDSNRETVRNLIHNPHGIILVTGPTGSGKTTSLYASLTTLNESSRNILTVEDPVEYQLQGIGQTQVNPKVDMTFARGLRAILRQDPDVVMIGEIRDTETADIAVQASLTGHLVLSTLHTNTAVGAISRLKDMGIEPFLLSSSLLGVISQRLVRVLCPDCKKPHIPSWEECQVLNTPYPHSSPIYQSQGCSNCNHSGFRGRTGIYEVLVIDDETRRMIHTQTSEQEIINHVRQQHSSLLEDGLRKVLLGHTTYTEVLRVSQREG